MKAFTFLINGKENFGDAMAKVQPIWMKLRGSSPDISQDLELMKKAAKIASSPESKITIKVLA